jgi:hypothetical protein
MQNLPVGAVVVFVYPLEVAFFRGIQEIYIQGICYVGGHIEGLFGVFGSVDRYFLIVLQKEIEQNDWLGIGGFSGNDSNGDMFRGIENRDVFWLVQWLPFSNFNA